MPKCSKCGRKGLFLKLDGGLCTNCQSIVKAEAQLAEIKAARDEASKQLEDLRAELHDQQAMFTRISSEAREHGISQAREEIQAEQDKARSDLQATLDKVEAANAEYANVCAEGAKVNKNLATATRKIEKSRNLLRSIDFAIQMFASHDVDETPSVKSLLSDVDAFLSPAVTLDLQCLGMRDLRKRYRENEKQIEETLGRYKDRYKTKANITIYHLMTIALKAELQNVLYSLKYGKLDDAREAISKITRKYFELATDGNQSIAPTMKKFIGEIDFYFQEAVRIEYEYYVQKERAKEEQRAIREQMRQEAEDRKALEAEKKKIDREESKYQGQIEQLQDQLHVAEDSEKVAQLQARLEELQHQLASVREKKDEIATLQNGKAGNVYVISNLGSFGPDVFKIGMTRRLEPQERVDELGSASVPFPFDVHSFIFSDDAVALENKLHKILNSQRVNKVNLRKEFFRISLDSLEKLVGEIAPTAEFRRTMLAEQYNQSLSIDTVREPVPGDEDDREEVSVLQS